MAAILGRALCKPCEYLSDCCSSACLGCSNCCTRMCQGCDQCCLKCGEGCANCCRCVSQSCTDCCSGICGAIHKCCDAPFSGAVALGLLLSVVPSIMLAYYTAIYFGSSSSCGQPLPIWIIVCIVSFFLNLIFTLYMSSRLRGADFTRVDLNPKYNPNAHPEENQFQYAKHFFLEDVGVFIAIVVGLFEFAWAIVGLIWAKNSTCTGSTNLQTVTVAGAVILLVYIFVTILAVVYSVYSGYANVCVYDCNIFKCLCCCIYYPFMYHHDDVRNEYDRQHPMGHAAVQQANANARNNQQHQQQNQQQQQGGNPFAQQQQQQQPPLVAIVYQHQNANNQQANYQQPSGNNGGAIYRPAVSPPGPSYNSPNMMGSGLPVAQQQQYYGNQQQQQQQAPVYSSSPPQQNYQAHQQEGVPNSAPGGMAFNNAPQIPQRPSVAAPIAQPVAAPVYSQSILVNQQPQPVVVVAQQPIPSQNERIASAALSFVGSAARAAANTAASAVRAVQK